jgi:DNA-binding transcriptional regulator of glucitol operon
VRRFLTRHWIWLHIAVLVVVPTFLGLGWWQVDRAGAGNARSYGYAVEWPSLAIIVIVLYVRAIRMELRRVDVQMNLPTLLDEHAFSTEPPALLALVDDDEDDPELAAYNEYLNQLNERDLQKRR